MDIVVMASCLSCQVHWEMLKYQLKIIMLPMFWPHPAYVFLVGGVF